MEAARVRLGTIRRVGASTTDRCYEPCHEGPSCDSGPDEAIQLRLYLLRPIGHELITSS